MIEKDKDNPEYEGDDDDDEPIENPCPCCGLELHVGHRIYCIYGCPLKWHPHGALNEDEDEYPEVCPGHD